MFSANQKPFVICTRVTSFALVLQVCTRVTEELHSFLGQSELSNLFVHIIKNFKTKGNAKHHRPVIVLLQVLMSSSDSLAEPNLKQ